MPSTFTQADPPYKHRSEFFANKVRRWLPSRSKSDLIYDNGVGAEGHYYRQKNLGNIPELADISWTGSGAPSLTTIPTGGTAGEFYFRTDTPGTANQRIYVCTVSGTTAAIGTFVALV